MCRCLTLNKWSKTRSSSTNNYFVVTLNIKPSRYDDQLRPEGLHRVGGPQEGGGHRRALLRDEDGRLDTRRKVSWKGHYGLMITGYRDAAWLPETGRPDEWRGGGAGHRPQGRREGYGGALGSDLGRTLMSEQGGGAVLVTPGLLHLYIHPSRSKAWSSDSTSPVQIRSLY